MCVPGASIDFIIAKFQLPQWRYSLHCSFLLTAAASNGELPRALLRASPWMWARAAAWRWQRAFRFTNAEEKIFCSAWRNLHAVKMSYPSRGFLHWPGISPVTSRNLQPARDFSRWETPAAARDFLGGQPREKAVYTRCWQGFGTVLAHHAAHRALPPLCGFGRQPGLSS